MATDHGPQPLMPRGTLQALYEQGQRKRRRRGATWWLLVGWWWAPACWAGRVTLWLVAWPLGLWRSLRHGQRKAARR